MKVLRVGVARNHFFDELDPDVSVAMDESLKLLAG